MTLRRLYQRVASTRRSEAWQEDVDAFLAKCGELLAKAEATRADLLERGRLAGGARGPRPVHRAYEAPDRPDGPEDPAGGGDPSGRRRSFRSSRNIRGGSARGRRAPPWSWAFPSRSSRTSTSSSSSTGSCGRGATPMPRFPSSWPRGNASRNFSPAASTAAFHSPQNQVALGDRLELNAMPAKGRLSASRSAHEAQPGLRTGAPAASRRRVGNQQSSSSAAWTGCAPMGKAGFAPHGRLVHPRCKCAPCRFLDPRTGTRTTQVPATKSCLTSPGNPASAARTGLPAALHARYFRKSPIWAPKSPPARRLPPNVADQVHLTLNPPVRSGSNLTAEAGSNSKKGGFSADTR